MPSTHKKIAVRTRERGWLCGHLDPHRFRQHGRVQWLSLDGQMTELPASEVKGVFFLASFDVLAQLSTLRIAATRPRLPGLWVRVDYADGDSFFGILGNRLTDLDGTGLFLLPPLLSAPFQRVYIPREAMAEAAVLGIIGQGRRRRPPSGQQIGLFPGGSSAAATAADAS